MPKTPKIRIRKQDKDKVKKTVRNFNAKIDRIVKKNPLLKNIVPNKITQAELLNINNRRDFNNKLRSYSRFLKRGAQEIIKNDRGTATTKWQYNEALINIRTINRQRSKKLKQADYSVKKGNANQIDRNTLNPIKFNFAEKTPQEWDRFVRAAEKKASQSYSSEALKRYRENYIKAIYQNFDIDEKGQQILDIINNTPPELLVEASYNSPILVISFPYGKEEEILQKESILSEYESFFRYKGLWQGDFAQTLKQLQ